MTYDTSLEMTEIASSNMEALELGQELAEASLPAFRYDGNLFTSWEEACEAVMERHPELLDDEMPDYFDNHIEEI